MVTINFPGTFLKNVSVTLQNFYFCLQVEYLQLTSLILSTMPIYKMDFHCSLRGLYTTCSAERNVWYKRNISPILLYVTILEVDYIPLFQFHLIILLTLIIVEPRTISMVNRIRYTILAVLLFNEQGIINDLLTNSDIQFHKSLLTAFNE